MKPQQNRNTSATIQQQRIDINTLLRNEYLQLIVMLYGFQIEQGIKTFNDFKKLTMRDLESNIRLRTVILKNEKARLDRAEMAKKTANKQKEAAVLEFLKKQNSGI
jgi:hypothetical protein